MLGSHNVLVDSPPYVQDKGPQIITLSHSACRHDFATVEEHSYLPPLDHRAVSGDRWVVQAICTQCRTRVQLESKIPIDSDRPCPNSDFPLHHFQLLDSTSSFASEFRCSSASCRTHLSIQYLDSSISKEDLHVLTAPSNLQRRYEQACLKAQDTTGLGIATPAHVYKRLQRYITDALANNALPKKIPNINKRFLEAFGTDCDSILDRLGFRYDATQDPNVWLLPQTSSEDVDTLARRNLLDIWAMELQLLLDQTNESPKTPSMSSDVATRSYKIAKHDMSRTLSAQNYSTAQSSRTNDDKILNLYYASLGALGDFADSLIEFCYDRQIASNPQDTPYYYDCLCKIAQNRNSESLQLKATMLESEGIFGRRAIEEAYQFLDVDPSVSDTFIADKYRSRYDDTGPSMRPRMKEMLQRLVYARQSQELFNIVTDSLESYQQALSWLGAKEEYNDEAIITLHTTKVSDEPAVATMARQAIQLIADHRNSEGLKSWLSTGELRETGMDIDTACRHLKIQMDLVDQSMLHVVIDNARQDNPGHKTELAIAAVEKAYREGPSTKQHNPAEWPVGLTSHGNTCYLNSLLQYYFTIKPLRDLVLNFSDNEFDLVRYETKGERVGARKIKAYEIRAYQKFVRSLAALFRSMITSPGPSVKPETDLVCRAFLTPEETETTLPSRVSSQTNLADVEMTDGDTARPDQALGTADAASSDSSATLVDVQDDRDPTQMQATRQTDATSLSAPALPPRVPTTPEMQESNLQKAEEAARQQQDVTEVMDEIMFRLRCAIKPLGVDEREEQLDAFREIFYMRIAEVNHTNGSDGAPRIEYAMNILLNVPMGRTDIYSALDEIFELQNIDHGGKFISQYKTLQTVPPILQINIPRNTYDRTTGRGIKIEHKMHLEDILYMDRYTDVNTDSLERRKRCWAWRRTLEALSAERDALQRNGGMLNGPDSIAAASKYLSSLNKLDDDLAGLDQAPIRVEEDLITSISQDADLLRHRLTAIDDGIAKLQASIANEFQGMQDLKYRLHAVFFHRGGYGHGHYWTYIRDATTDTWRIYNDGNVDVFSKLSDIYDAETWQQGTPTYAVYVRDDVREQYIQTVCRDVSSSQTRVVDGQDMTLNVPPPPPPKDRFDDKHDENMPQPWSEDIASLALLL